MISENASAQTEATSRSQAANLIALDSADGWLQLPLSELIKHPTLAKTANHTMTTAENGTLFHNTGATGTVVITLPAATVGLEVRAHVRAAFALRLDPNGSEIIGNATAGSADGTAGQYIGSSTVGASIHLICMTAGRWEVQSVKGTWVLA